MRPEQERAYARVSSVVFLKTDAPFGGLSNMAPGYPLRVNGIRILTSEALYQACRFPHRPEIQRLIIEQKSPMTAKMKSKPYRPESRSDWDQVRVKIMRWCLRVKLAQNWRNFSDLLLETDARPIVEESRKDEFWGAKATDGGTLIGMNVLGRLLMELREAVKAASRESLTFVQPIAIPVFLLDGRPIEVITALANERGVPPVRTETIQSRGEAGERPMAQPSLFDRAAAKEVSPPAFREDSAAGIHIGELKPYTEYKDSGLPWLGQVPRHWVVKRAKSIFKRIDERSKTGREELLTVSSARGVVPRRTVNVTMFKAESYLGYKLCWPGDLVINSLWAWAGGLGVSRCHGIVSSAYGVYRAREVASMIPAFVHEVVRSSSFSWELRVRSKGVWISRLQLTDISFLDAPIHIPPPAEQVAIVRFLDWANGWMERAIRAKRKVIGLLNEQKQAIIHLAVTRGLDPSVALKPSGIAWLGDIPQHWEVRRFKMSVGFQEGPGIMLSDFREAGVPLLRISCLAGQEATLNGCNYLSPAKVREKWSHFAVRPGDYLKREWKHWGRPPRERRGGRSDSLHGHHQALAKIACHRYGVPAPVHVRAAFCAADLDGEVWSRNRTFWANPPQADVDTAAIARGTARDSSRGERCHGRS